MLVDARGRFAERVANWMRTQRLPREEIVTRLSLFPEEFILMVNEAAKRQRNQK